VAASVKEERMETGSTGTVIPPANPINTKHAYQARSTMPEKSSWYTWSI
jgi:hypothetical protein